MNWQFPKIVVPPKSSILRGFSIRNHLAIGVRVPPLWKPPGGQEIQILCRWQELDDRLQEQVVQKNHLLQVLNKEDLEGAAAGAGLRYTFIFYSHSSFDFIYIYIHKIYDTYNIYIYNYMIYQWYVIYIYIWSMILYYCNYVLIDWFAEIKKELIPQRVRSIPQVGGGSVGCQEHCWHGALVKV